MVFDDFNILNFTSRQAVDNETCNAAKAEMLLTEEAGQPGGEARGGWPPRRRAPRRRGALERPRPRRSDVGFKE